MSKITRKDFLGLSAAAVTSAVLGNSRPANARQDVATAPGGSGPLLIRGADLLTMDPVLGEQQATDVRVENGRITAIGKGLPAAGAESVDADGMILMPGMCDGHRHLWHTVDAGRLVKTQPRLYATYQEWKMRTIVSMRPEDHYLAGFLGGLMAIDSGVTSLVDYAHGQINAENALAAARGAKDSGVGGWFAFQLGVSSSYQPGDTVPLDVADAQRIAKTTATHWATAERLQKEVFTGSDDIMQLGLAPASGTGSSLEEIREEWGRIRDMGVRMLAAHVHKPSRPTPKGTMGFRDTGIPDLQEAGVLGPDYHLAHANRLTAEELRMLRDTGGMVCATAMGEFPYMAAAHRGPSVHGRSREAGVATGIGIDVNLVLTQDYFEHARAAFWSLYLSPDGTKIATGYTSDDTLDFVSALGAKAMRLGDETGTITVGKRADLVLLRTDRAGFASLGSLADRVLNFASLADIDSVWVAGKARKRHGEMLDVDWPKLKAEVADAQARIGPAAASITFT
jgi:cytosine/adenosine deaminase-related metal-dependent hydrolase